MTKQQLLNFPAPPRGAPSPYSFGEFFAGVGLARIGLERAGWTIAFANDLDEQKLRMYEGHFGPAPYYSTTDIHDLADTPDLVPDFTLAHASFPCTDLSLAGSRRGIRAGQSSAFWGFHRLLEAKGDARPALVLLENVTGFLSSQGGDDFHAALRAMNDLGYAVDAFTIDAAHFVPQSRPRLFVLCKRTGGGPPTIDPSELTPSALRPASLIAAMRRYRDLDWSVCRLPELPPYGKTKLASIVDRLPDDSPQWWSVERAEYLLNQMSPRHRALADAMIAKRAWSYGTVFRRVRNARSMAELRTDGIAGCLRTPKGGSGRQILFQAGYGKYKVRLLNPDECARLMGAGGYKVTVPLNQALFGFGDAVCADVIEWIAANYMNELVEPAGSPLKTLSGAGH